MNEVFKHPELSRRLADLMAEYQSIVGGVEAIEVLEKILELPINKMEKEFRLYIDKAKKR